VPFQVRHELGHPLVGKNSRPPSIVTGCGRTLVDPLAHVVLASVNEVALLVAQSDDPEAVMRSGSDAIDELLSRLLG
jgi:Tetracyclin repressor-like, C-terminal domain